MYSAVLKAFGVDKKDTYNKSKDSIFNVIELNTSEFSEKILNL